MKRTKYTAEFKSEVVKQIIEKKSFGHLGCQSLSGPYRPTVQKGPDEQPIEDVKALQAEMTKLKAELRRTAEERDFLKKAAAYFAKASE